MLKVISWRLDCNNFATNIQDFHQFFVLIFCFNLILVAPIIPDIKTSFDTSNFEPISTLDEDSIPEETSNWDQYF